MEGEPQKRRELTREEIADAQEGLLRWHIEEQEKEIGIDYLTGVRTRKAFERELLHALDAIKKSPVERNQRGGNEPLRELALVFIDLDNFGQVNKSLGHGAGDKALQQATKILTSSIREADVIGRRGGDEFFVFLPRSSEQDAVATADKMLSNLRSDPLLKQLGVTASVGVYGVNKENATDGMETLMGRADSAQKKAKEGGKNSVEVYKP